MTDLQRAQTLATVKRKPPEEGAREPSVCGWCHSPIWLIYHGPNANHTTEPRIDPPVNPSGALTEAAEQDDYVSEER